MKPSHPTPVARALCALLLLLHAAHCQAAPDVASIEPNTTLRYPIAFLAGRAEVPDGSVLQVENQSSRLPSRVTSTQVLGGRFKALAELVPGPNTLLLRDASGQSRLALRYQPMSTPRMVRVIYVTGAEGDTDYPTQKANDAQDYEAKLALAARLIQSFTGESMHARGWGRRSFRLEEDARGQVVVHTVRAPRPSSAYQAMGENEVGEAMRDIVNPRFPVENARNLVVMATSGYDTAQRRSLGHTANANRGTGVFSALDLFSWPSSLQEVQAAFSDPTRVDASQVADDSNGRGALWALASTTLGVTLHEMGHTFGLPHSPDGFSIMSRGHDFFNRFWALAEPPSAQSPAPSTFRDDEIAWWEPASAARLALSPFLEVDARPAPTRPEPLLWSDIATGDIVASAPAGLGALALERDGLSRDTLFDRSQSPLLARWARSDLEKAAGGPGFAAIAIDAAGRSAFASTESLADTRLFLRSWRFAPAPQALADPTRLPTLGRQQVQQMGAELEKQPLEWWWAPAVDLNARYKTGEARNKVAYAFRELECARAQEALLLSGSDDSLRVWLNGELVVHKPLLRATRLDEDRTRVSLRAGRNSLLVEVGTLAGGWSFALRLLDAASRPLAATPGGEIAPVSQIYDSSRFVRAWRRARATVDWPSSRSFIEAGPQLISERQAELARGAEQESPSPYIDLLAHHRAQGSTENKVAYALSTLRLGREQSAVLLTGSDDALRVWLNGELVVQKLALRAAEPDTDRTPIALRAGENRLLVEVSTTSGGWGFYLRVADEKGSPLAPP